MKIITAAISANAASCVAIFQLSVQRSLLAKKEHLLLLDFLFNEHRNNLMTISYRQDFVSVIVQCLGKVERIGAEKWSSRPVSCPVMPSTLPTTYCRFPVLPKCCNAPCRQT